MSVIKIKLEYLERNEHELRVFENRVPKKYLELREKINNRLEKITQLGASENMVRVIKSKIMKWAGHVSGRGR
jgi:thymidylate kinase